jgi:hypothetical protein
VAKNFEAIDEELKSNDWRAYFDSTCLRVWHLAGKERTFKISKVTRLTSEMVSGNKREVKKQPKLELVDEKGRPVPLPLLLNKTNCKTIATLYGNNPGAWVGKSITIFPTTTSFGSETKECIRVRNAKPGSKRAPAEDLPAITADEAPAEREPGDDDEPPMGALEGDNVPH